MFTTVAPFCLTLVMAQAAPETPAPQAPQAPVPQTEASVPAAEYRIGVDDALSIGVLQAPELNTTARVSEAGEISLPLLGVVRAVGLSAQELEREIEAVLRAKYIRDPDVSVQVTEIRSREVAVLGAVRKPGTFQMSGASTLLEVLSLAGGLAEDAGESAMVIRGGAALGATTPGTDSKDTGATAHNASRGSPPPPIEVKLKALMESRDAHANIAIYPGDVVTVRIASMVYVVGAIKKPGAFATPGNAQLTVLRAIALGEGLTPTAAAGDAMVVRTSDEGARVEIPVDLDDILTGKAGDIPLEAQDVLFVPTSGGKVVARATLDALVRIVSFRPY